MPDNFDKADLDTQEKYLKLTEGTHHIRILEKPIAGYEEWTKEDDKRVVNRKKDRGDLGSEGKPFWALIIWNYDKERIQVLNITQKSIIRRLVEFAEHKSWGNFMDYDIEIKRTGTTLNDTEYSVISLPKKKLGEDIAVMYKEAGVNIKALYENGDPFEDNINPDEIGDVSGDLDDILSD